MAGRLIQRATGVSPVRGQGYRASDIDDALLRHLSANTASAFLTKALSFCYRYPATDQRAK